MRTQMPYALLVGVVAILVCSLPVGMGMPWWAGLVMALVILWLVLHLVGTKMNPQET